MPKLSFLIKNTPLMHVNMFLTRENYWFDTKYVVFV